MDILGTIASAGGNLFTGGFLGLIGTLAPMIIHFFQSRQDNAHELAMRELDIRASQVAGAQRIEEINVQGDWDAYKAALDAQSRPSGVKWVDAFSTFIRPYLTFHWCVIVYTAVKIAQFVVLQTAAPQESYANLILKVWWNDFDQQLIGGMFVFWFTPRVMSKLKIGKA